ncbi:MAG: PDZ domain-containing protein [Saprospiraceae bacterium]|nr:PDZ domain-containing protein [Saprospiraceae bacterium]
MKNILFCLSLLAMTSTLLTAQETGEKNGKGTSREGIAKPEGPGVSTSSPNKAVLGVMLENVDGNNGAQVIECFSGSAAEKAGLREGDILLNVAGRETPTVEAVIEALSVKKPGDKVRVRYLRNAREGAMTVQLQERKEETVSMPEKPRCCKPGERKHCKEVSICRKENGEKRVKIEEEEGRRRIVIRKEGPEGTEERVEEIEIEQGEERVREKSLSVEYLSGSPNPSEGQLKIAFSGPPEPMVIEVVDLNGKEHYRERVDDFDGRYEREVKLLNAQGTLILKVTQGEKVLTQKIIVK